MVTADVFVAETELKNQESFRGLMASAYLPALAGEATSVEDMLRLESKFAIESRRRRCGRPIPSRWR